MVAPRVAYSDIGRPWWILWNPVCFDNLANASDQPDEAFTVKKQSQAWKIAVYEKFHCESRCFLHPGFTRQYQVPTFWANFCEGLRKPSNWFIGKCIHTHQRRLTALALANLNLFLSRKLNDDTYPLLSLLPLEIFLAFEGIPVILVSQLRISQLFRVANLLRFGNLNYVDAAALLGFSLATIAYNEISQSNCTLIHLFSVIPGSHDCQMCGRHRESDKFTDSAGHHRFLVDTYNQRWPEFVVLHFSLAHSVSGGLGSCSSNHS
jgi:hypothetical protein